MARLEKPLVIGLSTEKNWLDNLKQAGADFGAHQPYDYETVFRSPDYAKTIIGQYESQFIEAVPSEKQQFYALHHGQEFDDRSQETADTGQDWRF